MPFLIKDQPFGVYFGDTIKKVILKLQAFKAFKSTHVRKSSEPGYASLKAAHHSFWAKPSET